MPKNVADRRIDRPYSSSSGALTVIGSGGGGGGGVTDHGALTGLADDDHSQYHNDTRGDLRYLKLSGGTLTGDVSANAGVTIDGVDVGALKPHSVIDTTYHSATGMTLGEVLKATGFDTFDWEKLQISELTATFGNGLILNSNTLDVELATDSGLQFSSAQLTMGTPTTLTTATTNALVAGSHSHAVTTTNNAYTAPSTILAGGASGELTLARLDAPLVRGMAGTGAMQIGDTGGDVSLRGDAWDATIGSLASTTTTTTRIDAGTVLYLDSTTATSLTSDGYIEIVPTGNAILDPGSSKVLPGDTIEDDLGDYNRMWRTLYAAELYVETLVAQDVLSTIGGRIMVAPTTKLIATLPGPGASGDPLYGYLFAHWDLNETSGTRTDEIGFYELTPVNSPSYTTGKQSNAAAFVRSSSQRLYTASNASLQMGDIDFAVGCWFYLTVGSQTQYVWSKGGTSTSNTEYRLQVDSSNRLRFYVCDLAGSTVTTWTITTGITTGTWYYCVVWHDSINDQLGAYVNGATYTTSHTAGVASRTGDFTVGASGTSNYLDGYVDELSVWRGYIPDATDLAWLYNTGSGRSYTELSSYGLTLDQLDVEHNNLSSGDYAIMKTAPGGVAQMEVVKVTSAATPITGGYRYTVTRAVDGTPANEWVAGDAIAVLGNAVGDGYIELTSTETVHSHLGPNITIYSRTGTTNWDDVSATVALGNLRSFVDYGSDLHGLAIGNDLTLTPTTGFKGLTADQTNGLRMWNTAIKLYSGATQTVDIDPTGIFKIGTNLADPTKYGFYFVPSTGALTIGGATYPGTVTLYGVMNIKATSSGYANLTDKPTDLGDINAGEGTKLNAGLDASGNLITKVLPGSNVGTPSGAGLYLGADKMGYYNGSSWRTYMDNTGKFYFAGASGAGIAWDNTDLYGTDGATVQWYARASTGKLYAGGGKVQMDASGIDLQADTASSLTDITTEMAWYQTVATRTKKTARVKGYREAGTTEHGLALHAYGNTTDGYNAVVDIAAYQDTSGVSAASISVDSSSDIYLEARRVYVTLDTGFLSIGTGSSYVTSVRAIFAQADATGANPPIELRQSDLSEEMIQFTASVAAGNPIDTAAVGSYYGKVRVSVNGTFKYIPLYNS